MSLPVLTPSVSARLTMRSLTPRDARELLAVVASSREELGRFMTWPREMVLIEHARRFVALGRDGWLEGRTARFGMFERATGELVGSIELDGVDMRRRQAELGYWVRTDRTHRGYATEAAQAVLHYGFHTLGMHKIRADAAVGNSTSARVLEKLGFAHEGTLREDRLVGAQFIDHWRFGLLAREFIARYAADASAR